MMRHEIPKKHSPVGRDEPRRLLPTVGILAAVVAVLVHLGGGALLVGAGPGAAITTFGEDVANLGGLALALGVAAVVALKLLVGFGVRRWLRHR